jgi:hypothetical protein
VNIFETLLLMVVLIVFPIRSSYGQTLITSTFSGETLFSILISISGLGLFSHLIGNMQVLFAFRLRIVGSLSSHASFPPFPSLLSSSSSKQRGKEA